MMRAKPYMEGFHDPEEKEPMEMTSRPSGLVVPKPPPKPPPPPPRQFGPMEIQDPEAREKAKKALSDLWDAMGLRDGGGLVFPLDRHRRDVNYGLYYFVGEALLGDECPEGESLT